MQEIPSILYISVPVVFQTCFWILHNNVYTLCLSLNTLDSFHQLINTDEMVVSFEGHIQNVHYLENHNSNVQKKVHAQNQALHQVHHY